MAMVQQQQVHNHSLVVKVPISNARGSNFRSVVQPPRRGNRGRSNIVVAPPSTFKRYVKANTALATSIAATSHRAHVQVDKAAAAGALVFTKPDPSTWPSSGRSAYGVRSTVQAPAPRHRLSNKRALVCAENFGRPMQSDVLRIFVAPPQGVRGFQARSTCYTNPGVTRGQQVRSFAAPTARVVHAGDGPGVTPLMLSQAGRASNVRSVVVAPSCCGAVSDRVTHTIGRVHADRSTIAPQTRAYTARSYASPLRPSSEIWSQEHEAVQQEWEKMLEEIVAQEEEGSIDSADSSGFVHVAAPSIEAAAQVAPSGLKSPTLEKKKFMLTTSSTYPIKKAAITGGLLAPKARHWTCCGCSNRNYLFRTECGRCEMDREESMAIVASRCTKLVAEQNMADAQQNIWSQLNNAAGAQQSLVC